MVRKKRNANKQHPPKRRKIQSEEELNAALVKIRHKIRFWPRDRFRDDQDYQNELKFLSLVNLVKNSKNVAISVDCARCLALVQGVYSDEDFKELLILQEALRENPEEKRLHEELLDWWKTDEDHVRNGVKDIFLNQIQVSNSDKAIAMCAHSLFHLEQDKVERRWDNDDEEEVLQNGSIIWKALERIQNKTVDDRVLGLLVELYSPIDEHKDDLDELQKKFEKISEEVIECGSTESIFSMAKAITSFGDSYTETSFELIKRGLQVDPNSAVPVINHFLYYANIPKQSDKIFIYDARLQIVQMRSAAYEYVLKKCTQYAELYEIVKDLKRNFTIQGESSLKKILDRFAILTPGYKALVKKLYPNSYQAVKEFAKNQTQWFTAFVPPCCEDDFPVEVTKCILEFMYFMD